MCQYSTWSKGYPMRGDYYPACAQGAFLPGDEPGWRCQFGGHCCEEECPEGEEYWAEHGETDYPDEDYR